MLRRDLWHQEIKHPCKMGCDLVGRVVNVGNKCDDIKVGDRVCAVGLAIGGNAKYAILPSSRAFCCPEDIHPTQVACLARNYMAAYQSLHRAGGVKIRPGNKVLILGGAGALGQALIQLAVAAGADEVYATGKGSNSKRVIENLGAQSLGRKVGEWLPYVKGEMDIVIDSVCEDDFVSSHRALKRNGKLVCVGSTAVAKKTENWNGGLEPKKRFSVVEMASSMSNTSFYDVFSSLELKRDVFRKDLFRLFHLCRTLEITPKVAFCVSLNEVANSHLDLEAGGIDGTIVCLPWGCEGRALSTRETEQDLITEYEDGVQVRESLIGGQMKPLFGKVMKDGTFKILSKDRDVFNDYDDDLYSRAGDAHRPSTQGDLRRVDSTPFGFQDDMDKSYHRGMCNDDNDEDTRVSSYKARNKQHSSHADDNYSRSGRQPVPRPGTRSNRRETTDDPDDYIYGGKGKNRRRDTYGDDDDVRSVRSSSRRGSSRNAGSRRNEMADDDDDMRCVRSSSRRGSSRNTGSRRNVMADDDDDMRSVRSSSRRISSRNAGSRRKAVGDDDDDMRSVRSSSRRRSSRVAGPRRNAVGDDDDDMRSVRSRHNKRGGSSRNEGASRRRDARDEIDDHSVVSKSRTPASIMRTGSRRNLAPSNDDDANVDNEQSRPRGGDAPDDYSLKRTPSILRNGNNSSARPQSRGTSPRHEGSRSSRAKPSSRGGSSRAVVKSSQARSTSREVQQPVPRARSISRDPNASRTLQRGRTRSRSIDSKRSDDRSPSPESVYSQGTQKSALTANSDYTKDSAYSADNYSVALSVATRESEYTPPEIHEKEKSHRKKVNSTRPPEKARQKEVAEEIPRKKGLFSRLRSKSSQRTIKAEHKISVSTKPKRSSSKIPPPTPTAPKIRAAGEKGERRDRRIANNPKLVTTKDSYGKRSSSKRRENNRGENGRDRERDHKRDDHSDEASNDYYEEEDVRSVVLLKGASEDTLSEEGDEFLRGSRNNARDLKSIVRKDRSGGSRRSSSKRSSSLRSSRGSAQRPSSRAPRQSSSSNRQSRRSRNDDDS